MNWHRTPKHDKAELAIRAAFRLFTDARTVLTVGEFTDFIRENCSAGAPAGLGGRGFVSSIGRMITDGATIEITAADTGGEPRRAIPFDEAEA